MNFFQPDRLPASLQAVVSLRNLVAGQILFLQNDSAEAIFAVESGRIRLVHYTEDGQQLDRYSVRAGESFAEPALLNRAYDCTAIADVASRVWVLPKQPFLTALRQYPDLAEVFIAQLAQHLHETRLLLMLRSIRSAQRRVLRYLQMNVQADGVTVNFDRPLKDLAEDLDLTPETLSRTLKQLQTEGTISRRKRRVTLCKE